MVENTFDAVVELKYVGHLKITIHAYWLNRLIYLTLVLPLVKYEHIGQQHPHNEIQNGDPHVVFIQCIYMPLSNQVIVGLLW